MIREDYYAATDTTIRWPDTDTGTVDDDIIINGVGRPMTPEERAEWQSWVDDLDRDADAVALRDDLQLAKDVRDAAIQSRVDMDHETPDPAALAKWAPENETDRGPVSRTGNQSTQITALQDQIDLVSADLAGVAKLANDLRLDQRRQYGDTRKLAAMLVRKFRKDRDDE